MLKLENIFKTYESATQPLEVLRGVSLEVAPGRSVAIVGPSGCGKSTLLNLIGGLDKPDAGSVCLDQQDLSKLGAKLLAQVRNQKIGYVFQLHHLMPQCTVRENILLPTLAQKHSAAKTKQLDVRADKLLDAVEMSDKAEAFPAQLSGGQRQRVAVLRAMINQPKLILADEPTGSLDEKTAVKTVHILTELCATMNTALVLVTHSAKLARKAHAIYELRNGLLTLRKTRPVKRAEVETPLLWDV